MRKTAAQRRAEILAPPPPVEITLADLKSLAVRSYETKARTRKTIQRAHLALADVLEMIESYARYPDLISRGVADALHKDIRRRLRLTTEVRDAPR